MILTHRSGDLENRQASMTILRFGLSAEKGDYLKFFRKILEEGSN
jgi:hypothetical protein